jgi:N-acyl-D-aspartate/D-glutamate deacylase
MLIIRNDLIVDSTGSTAHRADIAISIGKIVEIAPGLFTPAHRTIDATGLTFAPGLIDPHRHYDAQICWDGATTPSSWHGVTSVVMGNCGVGIAPCRPQAREVAMRDLVNVEEIPFEVLNAGITKDWETFPESIDAAEMRKPSLNLAFMPPPRRVCAAQSQGRPESSCG